MHRLAFLLATAIATAAIAGPLTPPAGPPAPTNKTLQQVEPRTPVANTSTTIIIDQPGSYDLTDDITSDADGIRILTDGVTLDLNGFAVIGGPDSPSSDTGIDIRTNFEPRPVIVRNEAVVGFTDEGVLANSSDNTVQINTVHVRACGIGFRVFGAAILKDCTARACDGDGFETASLFQTTFNRCHALNNTGDGFRALSTATLTSCTARRNANGFNLGEVMVAAHCAATDNTLSGYVTGKGATLTACVARDNGGGGLVAGEACVFRDCLARANTLDGFLVGAGSSIDACTATTNGEDGFALGFDCRISNSSAEGNGSAGSDFAGIRGNSDCTIDHNTATDNPTGMIAGGGALLIRNTAAGNTTAYDTAGARFGLVITPGAGFSEPNSFANIAY
ncbi:MAG: right-handed parallel beta-helix repeat-containing protein [Planctomycetota bacterium]